MESIFSPKKATGVAGGIRIYFISDVFWMCDWEETILRTFKENAKMGIKVIFARFVKMIGRELVHIDAQNVLMMIFHISLLSQLLYFSYFYFLYM